MTAPLGYEPYESLLDYAIIGMAVLMSPILVPIMALGWVAVRIWKVVR